jgi:uncharacterized protein involved in response to NO
MTMIRIEESTATAHCLALFAHGFRPFFLAAGIQALVGVAVMALAALAGAT